MEETDYGVFIFKGNEDEIALRWMWICLCDLSWYRVIEVIFRIVFKRPPINIMKWNK